MPPRSLVLAKPLNMSWNQGQLATFATDLQRPRDTHAVTASGRVRQEVPLPSQEKKEGAMQYAL